jgi:enamine deaminase RidA (YjgF/YER057c/UK114 family)
VNRKNVSLHPVLEKQIGFSRAVRIGNAIAVTGTAPTNPDGSAFAPGDVYAQAKRCLEIIESALSEAGGSIGDVIRTRILLTDMSTWKEAARAHAEYFSEIRPATTFVQVSAFIDPDWMIEVEADAVVENG